MPISLLDSLSRFHIWIGAIGCRLLLGFDYGGGNSFEHKNKFLIFEQIMNFGCQADVFQLYRYWQYFSSVAIYRKTYITNKKSKEIKNQNCRSDSRNISIANLNTINGILGIAFIGALTLTIWEIKIYQKTFIPLGLPVTIWILTGIILTPILNRFLNTYLPTLSFFWHFVYNVITFGGLIVFCFMWINYSFASKNPETINKKIISIGYLSKGKGGCAQPFVVVRYNEQEKQLVYYCGINVAEFKSVDLTISKGFFGFDIVINSTLRRT